MVNSITGKLKNRLFFLSWRMASHLPGGLKKPVTSRLNELVLYDQVKSHQISFQLGVHRSQAFLWNESYETDLFRWLSQHAGAGDHCVDVGANVGRVTLFLALLVGREGKVDAVEPIANNCALLRKNVMANRLCDVVRVHEACSSSSDEEVLLHLGPNSFAASLSNDFGAGEVRVKAITIDSLSSADKPINLVKIDVEGAEADVLKGARQVLTRDRPKLIIEMHPPFAYEVPEIIRSFDYAGYSLSDVPLSLDEVARKAAEQLNRPFHVVFLPN